MNRIPAYATLIVAISAGILAMVATSEVAVSTGAVSTPALGWLLPIIIEGGAVTAGLLAWRRTNNELSAWPERLALFVLMALAVCVNAAHADGTAVLGVVLAASPPVVLVVSIELLLRNLAEKKRAVRKRPASAPVKAAAPAPTAPVKVASSVAPVKAALVDTSESPWTALKPAERRALVEEALAADPEISGAALAIQVGCGASTARRLLAQAREQIAA